MHKPRDTLIRSWLSPDRNQRLRDGLELQSLHHADRGGHNASHLRTVLRGSPSGDSQYQQILRQRTGLDPVGCRLGAGANAHDHSVRPTGDWYVWLPAAIAPWGKCSGNHKNMSSDEAEKLVRWPTSIRSGESLLIEGCASTKPVQLLAAPITGHGQDVGVGVGVSGVYIQAAPEPLIDRGWLTTRLKQTVGVILFAVPLIVVPTVWGITKKPIVAGIATIALLLVTSIVLQLPVWAYLSVLLAAGAAFLLGMLLKK